MIKVGLFDGSSCLPGQSSGSYGQEVSERRPRYIQFIEREYLPITFYTDLMLEHVYNAPSGTINVAWLIEPSSISCTHYHHAFRLQRKFSYILSHDLDFLATIQNNKGHYYPFGGLFVEPRNMPIDDKTKFCSMILSPKRTAPGHLFRHEIAEIVKGRGVDLYGPEYTPLPTKSPALAPYKFSIVVEPLKNKGFFSEKLIDCLALNTIPIYWGCENLSMFLHPRGIIRFDNVGELSKILFRLNQEGDRLYQDYHPFVSYNHTEAKNYYCREDWIYENIPDIFEGG